MFSLQITYLYMVESTVIIIRFDQVFPWGKLVTSLLDSNSVVFSPFHFIKTKHLNTWSKVKVKWAQLKMYWWKENNNLLWYSKSYEKPAEWKKEIIAKLQLWMIKVNLFAINR